MRFHPAIADRLISGSTDGLVCVYDVAQETEDDALLQTFNPDVAVVSEGPTWGKKNLSFQKQKGV